MTPTTTPSPCVLCNGALWRASSRGHEELFAPCGIEVTRSATAELVDCTVLRNGEIGMLAVRNAKSLFDGTIISSENATFGIVVTGSSNATGREASVHVTTDGTQGIIITKGGSVAVSAGDSITAHDNEQNGIVLCNRGGLLASGGTINAVNNSQFGISVAFGGDKNVQRDCSPTLAACDPQNELWATSAGDAGGGWRHGAASVPRAAARSYREPRGSCGAATFVEAGSYVLHRYGVLYADDKTPMFSQVAD